MEINNDLKKRTFLPVFTMKGRIIYFLLLALLLADTAYSFVQHLNQPLDGDMAGGIVPAEDVKPVLQDPLGISVWTEGNAYPNPNRFFSHWVFKEYFTTAPLVLQNFTDPVDSIYLSSAIAKIIIQLVIISLLAFYISGTANFLKVEFVLSALLVAPFFQANGYRSYMGIIDPSPAYTFFYALPLALLLLYFAPFLAGIYHKQRVGLSWIIKLLWLPLALIVCLSGPLNPGIVLVLGAIFIPAKILDNYDELKHGNAPASVWKALIMSRSSWFYLIPVGLFSMYSLYLGQFNSVSIEQQLPLAQLYSRLPEGMFNLLTQKIGFPLLVAALIINAIIIRTKYYTDKGRKILSAFKWIIVFALLYILLLPLGGARDYRPYVVRYDTFMPITLAMVFIFGTTTLFLLKTMAFRSRRWFIPLAASVLLVFTLADAPGLDNNDCEKSALEMIAASKGSDIPAEYKCTVLSWNRIWDERDRELNTRLLKLWRVIPESIADH